MYKIDPYSYEKAKILKVNIIPSIQKNKKIDVLDGNNQYICSIGDIRRKDFPTYLKDGKEYAEYRQQQYWLRHRKHTNKWGTKAYYVANLLW